MCLRDNEAVAKPWDRSTCDGRSGGGAGFGNALASRWTDEAVYPVANE